MIRRFFRRAAGATARLVRDLYHLTRLCPRCRSGEQYLPITRVHVPPSNIRLAIGTRPVLLRGERR